MKRVYLAGFSWCCSVCNMLMGLYKATYAMVAPYHQIGKVFGLQHTRTQNPESDHPICIINWWGLYSPLRTTPTSPSGTGPVGFSSSCSSRLCNGRLSAKRYWQGPKSREVWERWCLPNATVAARKVVVSCWLPKVHGHTGSKREAYAQRYTAAITMVLWRSWRSGKNPRRLGQSGEKNTRRLGQSEKTNKTPANWARLEKKPRSLGQSDKKFF